MCDETRVEPSVLQMRSEDIDKILPALIEFQGSVTKVGKNKSNPHFGSRYADLAAIMDEIRPLLGKNNLAVVQNLVESSPSVVRLMTTVYHTSGQFFSSLITLAPSKTDPQGVGSAITYARRYSLSPLLGVVTEEDDDGNAASDGKGQGKPQTQPQSGKAQSGKSSKPAENSKPQGNDKPQGNGKTGGKSPMALRKEKVWNTLVDFFGGDQVKAKAVLMTKTPKPSKEWTEEDLTQLEGFVQDVRDGVIVVDGVSEGGGL